MKKTKLNRVLAGLLAVVMLVGMAPMALADTTTTVTTPFSSDNGLGSNSYRIPAMVTLSDGTLVAAADARWNTTYDGGGLDTAVAYSTDNGASWTTYLANYLKGVGDYYDGANNPTFIDPALAVDSNDTIYMLCDLYPYGVALNGNGSQTTPSTAVGFYDDNKLKLSANSHSSYDHYLNLTNYKIYSYNGDTEVTGYTVDAYFNITGTDGTDTNLFCSDSPYKVVRTGYLYLTKSTNGGQSWSAPTLLNLKTNSENVCLVGPGRGLVTSTGMIVFPVYSYGGSTESQSLSFVYSTDGTNWSRSTSPTLTTLDYSWSSEAAVVELNNGALRFFFRNDNSAICYVDYNNGWGTPVNTNVASNSDTQMSAISYSKTVDGQQVILLSCPTGPNGSGSDNNNGAYRTSGKLHVFTVGSDGTMTLKKKIDITAVASGALSGSNYTDDQGFFGYSCLTELKDGSVAVMYENNQYGCGADDSTYYTLTTKTFASTALGLTFDDDTTTDTTTQEVSVKVGESVTYTQAGAVSLVSAGDTSVVETTVSSLAAASGDTLSDGSYYIGDSVNWLVLNGDDTIGNANTLTDATAWTISGSSNGYTITSGERALTLDNSTGSVIPQTVAADQAVYWDWDSTNGFSYDGVSITTPYYLSYSATTGWIGVNTTTSYTTATAYTATTSSALSRAAGSTTTAITFTGKAAGNTTVQVGGVAYNVYVTDSSSNVTITNIEYVTLNVGGTQTYTDTTGNYENADTNKQPDTTIATMEVSGTTAVGGTTTVLGSKQTLPTTINGSVSGVLSDGNGKYLTINNGTVGVTEDINNASTFTITYVSYSNWGNTSYGYTIVSGNMYLTVDWSENLTASTSVNNYTNYRWSSDDGVFYISSMQESYYLNASTTNLGSSSGDASLYAVTTQDIPAPNQTEITFTGVAPGTTTAIVGTTQYNITVNSAELSLSVTPGGTVTTPVTGTVTAAQLAAVNTGVTATSDGTTLTFTGGTTEGTYGPFLLGNTQYTVTVATRGGYQGEVTVEVNNTQLLTVGELADGETVVWTVADETIAGVGGMIDGSTASNNALVLGITAGSSTTVTATVTDASGNQIVYTWKINVIAHPNGKAGTGTRYLYISVDKIEHCTVYYSVNGGDLQQVTGTGVIIDRTIYAPELSNVMFFVAPEDGYELSYIGAEVYTDASGTTSTLDREYYSLAGGTATDGSDTHAWPFDSADQNTIPEQGSSDWASKTYGDTANNNHGLKWPLLEGNFTIAELRAMYTRALALGCDGMTQITTNNLNNGNYKAVHLTMVAHPLPSMKKEITSVVGDDGTVRSTDANGEWGIKLNDTVTYTITIEFPAIDETYGTVTYSDMMLTDTLVFGKASVLLSALENGKIEFKSATGLDSDDTATGEISNGSITESFTQDASKITLTYTASFPMTYVNYALLYPTQSTDASTDVSHITNTAHLDYTYQAQYSSGSDSASADAKIVAYMWYNSVVIDFGLPVEITVSDVDYFQNATARYGKVELIKGDGSDKVDTLIYTPTSVAPEYDVITYTAAPASGVTDQNPITYGLYITNASNVLYEEGFMTPQTGSGADWVPTNADDSTADSASKVNGTTNNQSSVNAAPYGYDTAYATSTGPSGTRYVATLASSGSTKYADYMTFSFTGTGFDLIGACGPATGTLMVRVDKNGTYFKSYLVDTSFTDDLDNDGDYDKIYQVPIIHAQDWDLAEYTVTVTGAYIDYGQTVQTNMFGFGGFGGGSAIADVYELIYSAGLTDEQVDDVEFINMDKLYGASTYGMTDSDGDSSNGYTPPTSMTLEVDGFRVYRTTTNASYKEASDGTEYGIQYVNVIDAANSLDSTIAYVEPNTVTETITLSNYEDLGGPENEIYLKAGKSIALKTASSWVQVSLRSVSGATTAKLSGTNASEKDIGHATEMYYMIQPEEGILTITNTGTGLLAICNLKFLTSDTGSETMLLSLTEDDYPAVYSVLTRAVTEETPEEPEVPEAPSTPTTPVTPVYPVYPSYPVTPGQSTAFVPETLELKVDSYTVFGQKFVTITVTASTDVDKLTINGTPVWAYNTALVEMGLADEYKYTKLLVLDAGETATFNVVAYDENGLASKTYTITG